MAKHEYDMISAPLCLPTISIAPSRECYFCHNLDDLILSNIFLSKQIVSKILNAEIEKGQLIFTDDEYGPLNKCFAPFCRHPVT